MGILDLFGGEDRRLQQSFIAAYNAAHGSPDMRERVTAVDFCLEMASKIRRWPARMPTGDRFLGIMRGTRGRALVELGGQDPDLARLAILELRAAAELLDATGGRDLGWVLNNLSGAIADDPDHPHDENIERALKVAEMAQHVLDPKRDTQEWVNCTANLAGFYAERSEGVRGSNIEESIRLHNEVLGVLDGHGTKLQRAKLLIGLGQTYCQRRRFDSRGNIETGISHIQAGLADLSRSEYPLDWAFGQSAICGAFADRVAGERAENLETALTANANAISVFAELGLQERWAQAQLIRSQLLTDRLIGSFSGNLQDAIACCHRALGVFSPEAYPHEHYRALHALNETLRRSPGEDRSKTIDDVIATGEEVLVRLSRTSDIAGILVTLGNAYAERVNGSKSQNLERSVEYLERAGSLLDEREDPLAWASARKSLAQTYKERVKGLAADNIEMAIALVEEATVLVSEHSDTRRYSELLETLGEAFSRRVRGTEQQNLRQARDILDIASRFRGPRGSEAWLRLEQKYRHVEHVLRAHENNSEQAVSSDLPPLDPSEYLKSLHADADGVSAVDHPGTWMAVRLRLADAYTRIVPPHDNSLPESLPLAMIKNLTTAIRLYNEMLPVAQGRGDAPQVALLHNRIGAALGMQSIMARVLADEGGHAYANGESRKYFDRAIAARETAFEIIGEEGSLNDQVKAAAALGRLFTFEKEWYQAAKWYKIASTVANQLLGAVDLSEGELKATMEVLEDLAILAPYCALQTGDTALALELAESGRARLLAKSLSFDALPLSDAERSRLRFLRQQVSEQEQKLVSPRLFHRRAPLVKSIQLRKEIAEIVSQYAFEPRSQVDEALNQAVEDGSVVVIPVFSSDGGRILLAMRRGQGTELHVINCGSELETWAAIDTRNDGHSRTPWAERFRTHAAGAIDERTLYSAGQAITQAFVGPLVQALSDLQIPIGSRLNILPAGLLGVLPLCLASIGEGTILLDRYEISYNPSLTALRHAKSRAGRPVSSLFSFANPLGGGARGELPFATAEARNVAVSSEWGSVKQLLEGSVSAIDLLPALQEADVWHFATHARFDPSHPHNSYLDLGQFEKLRLGDLLDAASTGNPRLVVLSACSSGLHSMDSTPAEFLGLPTGFLHAGAAGVIGTLWPVNDVTTALLISRFFREYSLGTVGTSTALRTAQLWLRGLDRRSALSALYELAEPEDIEWRHFARHVLRGFSGDRPFSSPTYWSGFVHYGA